MFAVVLIILFAVLYKEKCFSNGMSYRVFIRFLVAIR